MKKYASILVIFLSIIVLAGCGNKSEVEKLKAENDSLRNITNENNAQIDQFMQAFNEIQQNLNNIKQKEHMIDLNTVDSSEMTPDMKNQINNDITSIYQMMQENEQALSTLKRRLRASGIKNKRLEKTIALYEQQMKQKDIEISTLKKKLEKMNFNMNELNKKIAEMKANMDTMSQIQQQQSQILNQQDKELHTVYYVVGTKKELIEHKILTKQGFLSKLSLDPDFDKSYFTSTDIRKLNEIPIDAKRIKLISKHPETSYKIIENDGRITKLVITNKDKFWNLSKFCVILVK
jgi:outer membrane murein-binding lipoprotein Lpp